MKTKNEKKKIYLTSSVGQTQNLAEKLAKDILKKTGNQKAILIGLEGDLGGGKTTFLKSFAKGLKIKEKILSPTFCIMRRFKIPKTKLRINSKFRIPKFSNFYHIDCYRIEKPKEILALNFEDIISDPKNIVCIEWADKIKKILPKKTFWIKFEIENKNQRKISIFDNQPFGYTQG